MEEPTRSQVTRLPPLPRNNLQPLTGSGTRSVQSSSSVRGPLSPGTRSVQSSSSVRGPLSPGTRSVQSSSSVRGPSESLCRLLGLPPCRGPLSRGDVQRVALAVTRFVSRAPQGLDLRWWQQLVEVLRLLRPLQDSLRCERAVLLPALERVHREYERHRGDLGNLDLPCALRAAFPLDDSPLFTLPRDLEQHYLPRPRPILLRHLPLYLASVGAELAGYESIWRHSHGGTYLALQTDVPIEIIPDPDRSVPAPPPPPPPAPQRSLRHRSSAAMFDYITGFQAAELLAQYRHLGGVVFLYLNRLHGIRDCYYDLRVAPPPDLHPEHFVFSPFGVLHVDPPGASETLELGAWHREAVLCRAVRGIPYFRHFLQRRAVRRWRQNVRRIRFLRTREVIGQSLVHNVPHYMAALQHIQRLLLELAETRWLPSASPGPASIHQMEETLGEVRTGGGMALENLLTLTGQILDLVREDTYTLLSSTQKDAQVPPPRNRPASRGRQQQVESWLSRLGNLASLAGHMICQNLHDIIQHNSRTFVYDVIQQRSPAPGEPFLQVDLKFGDDGDLILSPPNHQIQQSFSHALTAIIDSALQVSVQFLQSQGSRSPEAAMMNAAEPGCPPLPPLGESRLRAETCSPAPPPATCRDMRLEGRLQRSHYLPLCLHYLPHLLHSDPSISQARDTLLRLLQVSLQEVERFSEEHAWLGEIRRYVRCWSPRVLEQLRGKSSRDYEDLILRLQSWEQRVHGVSEFISTPVLRVSCSSIRAQTAPGLAAITQDIVTLLTSEVSRRSRDLILELGQVLEILRGVTTDIPAFSRCAHKVAEYTDKRGALQQGVAYTRSLQDVIRMNFRQLTAEEQSLDDQLRDTWDAFQHHLRTCGDFLSAHLTSMSDSLERSFLARRREAESIIAAGSAPRYLDPEQNAALVLRDLGELHHNLRSHLAQLRDLSQSRRILQGKSFDVSEISGGEQRLQGRQEVWKLLSRSREQISAWKLRPFLKVNIELMREKLCRWGRSLQDLGVLLSEADPVVCSGRSLLQDFSQHLPLLQSLLSPAMTPQHWAAIFTVMGATFPGLEELTLLQLLSCPLAQHQEQIQKITRRAHAEFSMEMDLKQIQTFWKEKSFTLVPFLLCVAAQDPAPDPSKRPPSGRFRKLQSGLCTRDSGTFLLTETSSLVSCTEDALLTLRSMKGSALAPAAIRDDLAAWIHKLQDLAMALDLWISFQQRWVFLMKVQHEMETPLPHAPTVEQLQSLSQAYGAFLLATLEDPRVLSILTPGRRREPHLYGSALCSAFRAGIRVMDDVIGQMEDVLYSYRCAFPRLFFLSDRDLLRVLAASPEPAERLTCALLCFPHLSDVTFQPQSPPASGFYLHSGCALTTGATGSFRERLDFTPPIPWTPRTVPWLSELEERLRDSVRGRVQRCLSDARGIGGVARWIERGLTYPWQCLRVTEEVLWCQDMERSLQANQKSSLQHRDKIERLAERLQSHGTLPRGQQALLSAWLALAIQQQERAQSLLEAPGPALDSFLWVTMMKYRVQQAPDRPEMAQQAPDRPEMAQQAPDRPEMAQQAPDRPEMAQQAPDRPEMAQQVPDRPEMAQKASDRPEMAQQAPDRPEIAQQAPDRPEMAQQTPDRPEMVQQTPDRPEMAQQAPDRPEMVQQAPDRPEMAQKASDRPEMAQKASDRPEIAQQAPDRPEMAQQAPDRPEMVQQAPDRPEMAQQTPDRPEMAQQAPDRPEMARQAPDRPEMVQQAPDRPEMAQQAPDRPEMARQAPDRPEMAQQAPDRPEMAQQAPDRPEMAQQAPDRPDMAQKASDRPEMAQQAPDRPEIAQQAPDRPEMAQQAPDRPEMAQQAPDRPEMARQAPDRPEMVQQAPDRPEMAQQAPDRPEMVQQAPDRPEMAPQAPDRPETVQQAPDRLEMAQQAPDRPEMVQQAPDRPEMAQQAPDRPEMAQQAPDRPEMVQQAPDRPEMAQQAPDRPEMAQQAPDRPEIAQQAPDRPEMAQQAPDRPEMARQAPDRPEMAQPASDRPEMAPPVPLLCYVDVLGYHLPYGWEYVGLDSSMADLPLTDRTTLGLMLALQQYQCGAVIGRDEGSRVQAPMALGAAVGRRVEVLNCWAGLSLGQLTSHLQGALRTGAWLVLGGVHQLPSIIQAGLGELLLEVQTCCREAMGKGKSADKAPGRLQLEGRTVPIAPGYGCFMTLPDVSASRPLPHKLRLLLRPVSLRTPDLRASAELALLAAGFQGHSYLAQKMARFFQLAQECGAITTADSSLLLRTIIQCATTILKTSLRGNGKSQGLPSKTDPDIAGPRSNHSMVRTNLLEEKSVMAALAMSAIGTGASASELGHLQDILRGIFPTYVSPSFTPDPDPVLRGAIAQDLQESGLEVHPDLSNSIAQLFQALQCGSGVLLTGPAGAGKTTCWKVLHRALNRLAGNPEPLIGQTSDRHPGPIQVIHLFPNSVSLEEFLGGGDDTAAIFSSVLRRAGGEALAQKWVILDSTPALEWMEPVSCFFSPHPVLTLAGGERLVLDSATKLVFEMSDMSTLSPAMAVSCSLVPCAGQETWRPIIRAFTSNMLLKYKITWSTRHSLQSLSDSLIPRILCFLEQHCTPALHPHMSQATARGVQEVSSFCAIFQALLDQHLLKDPDPTSSEQSHGPDGFRHVNREAPSFSEPPRGGPSHQRAHTYFLYAFIWGFGGHLHPRHRLEFGKFFRESLSHFGIRDEVPPEVSVFDVMPDGDGGALVPCVRAGFPQSEGLLYALRSLALSGHPVLMVGSPGSGKTNLMLSAIPHGSSLVRVPFYSALKASALRSLLRSRHEAPPPGGLKRARPLHTRHVFVFDDLHAATADAGSQTHPALETVRHIVWDPSSCVAGSFLAAASPPEHGARPLPPRLTRLFSVLVLAPFGLDRLLSLFSARFSSWLKKSLPRQQAEELGEALALASVRLYHKTLQTLPPRYSFSLHALHQVLRSMVALCPSPGPHLPALPSASAPAAVLTRHGVVLLWAHEVLRTFTDGLEDLRDRESVRDLLKDSMREIFYSAPVNTAQGASPSNTAQGASPSNTAQGASPSNTAQGASPSNTAQGASPSNTTQGASPSNTAQGASPSSTTEGASASNTTEGASPANANVPKTPMTLVKVTEGASPSTANVTVPTPQMTPVNTAKEEFPSTNNANVPMPRMTPVNMTNGASPSTADVTVPMPQVTPVNTAQGASPSTADANVPMPQVTPVNTTQGASPSTANVPMPQVTPVNTTQGASPSTADANVPMPQVTPVNTTQGASPSTANVPMPQVTPVNMTQGASPSTAKANVPMPLSPVSQSEEKATDQVTNPEAPGVTNMYVSTEMESLSFASTPLPQEKEGILPSELIPSDGHIASLHFSRECPPGVTDRADCLSYRERPLSSSLVLQTGNLTLCPASQQHLTRLTRVLLVPGGHIILLSHHPGTGRRSLVRLAARVTQCTLLELCGTESEGERHALLREACRLAGVLGIGTAILVDYCAPQKALMELEVLIREGTFLGLYSAEQEEVLLQAMAQVERSRNRATSRKALQERFSAQVRDNLHIIFIQRGVTPPPCMGPYCAMDLYQPWNRASLQAVAEQLLQDVPGSCTSAVSLPRVMSLIHVSAQSYCHRMWPTLPLTSPGTFTTFIRIFLSFLSHRKGSILKDMERLQLAICRVDEISAEREKWSQEAEVLSRSLQVATQEAERWRAELEETGNAEQQLRSECEELERAQEQVRGQVGTLQGRRREALEEACVQWSQVQRQLKVADVEELRSYRAPPDAVVMVTDVLCIVFGRRPGWESARLLLAQEDFYEELQFYDGHRMPDAVFSSLTQAVSRSEFRAPCVRPASAAVASLCDWLCGLQRFCSALRRLDGDKGLLSRAEAQHVKGAERMAECRLQQEQLRIMGEQRTRNLQLSRDREEELRGRVTQCQERLGLLQEYEEGAGPYRAAWRSALESLQKKLQTLVPDSLLASASICYLGSLPWPRCAALVGRWRRLCDGEEVPLDPDDVRDVLHPAAPAESSASLLLEILGGPADKMEWRGMGLPEDPETQTRAALLRAAAQHTPLPLLIIDPDNVAKRWLPALLGVREKGPEEKRPDLLILEATSPELRLKLPSAAKQGGAVLITDVEKDFTSMDVVQHFLLQPDQHPQPGATPEYGAPLREPILGATPEYGAALRDPILGATPEYGAPLREPILGATPEYGAPLREPILGATPEYGAPLRDPILGATPEYGAPLRDPILGATPEYGAPLREPILGATPEYGAPLRDPILGATPEYGAPLREPILGATPEYGAPLREPILGATPEYGAPLHGPILFCTSLPLGEFVEGCGAGAMKQVIVADLSLAPAALQEELLCDTLRIKDPRLLDERRRLRDSQLQLAEALQRVQDALLDDVIAEPRPLHHRRNFLRDVLACKERRSRLQESLADVELLQGRVQENMAPYHCAAQRGRALYSRLQEISRLSPQYRFPASAILCWARQALRGSERGVALEEVLVGGVLRHALAALTEDHRLVLRLLMAVGQPPPLEWFSFLGLVHRAAPEAASSCIQRPYWLDTSAWEELGHLERMVCFRGIRSSLSAQAQQWREYFTLRSTVIGPPPCSSFAHLTLFQTAILWRIVRPESLGLVLTHLTSCILGPEPAEPMAGDRIMTFYDARSPVLIPLPRHAPVPYHPRDFILQQAQRVGKEVKEITWRASLPESHAHSVLFRSRQEGHWVLLHWHPQLAPMLEEVADPSQLHPEFRMCVIVEEDALSAVLAVMRHSAPCVLRPSLRHLLPQSCMGNAENSHKQQRLPRLLALHLLLLHRQEYSDYVQSHVYCWGHEELSLSLRCAQRMSLDWPDAMVDLAGDVIYGGHIVDDGDARDVMAVAQQCRQDEGRRPAQLSRLFSPLLAGIAGCGMPDARRLLRALLSWREPGALGLSEGLQAARMEVLGGRVLSALLLSQDVWTAGAEPRSLRPPMVREEPVSYCLALLRDLYTELDAPPAAQDWTTCHMSNMAPPIGEQDRTTDHMTNMAPPIGEQDRTTDHMTNMVPPRGEQDRTTDHMTNMAPPIGEQDRTTDHMTNMVPPRGEQDRTTDHMTSMVPPRGGLDRTTDHMTSMAPPRGELDRTTDHMTNMVPPSSAMDQSASRKRPGPIRSFVQEEWSLLRGLVHQAMGELMEAESGCRCPRCQEVQDWLSEGQVPPWWDVYPGTPPPVTPHTWISELRTRQVLLSGYLSAPHGATYNLSAFRNPAHLLHALLLDQSLRDRQELHTYHLHVQVRDRGTPPRGAVRVTLGGVQLRHALWDTRLCALQETLSPRLCPLPELHLTADQAPPPATPTYLCPLYIGHAQHQQRPLMLIPLPTNLPPSVWRLRGVHALSLLAPPPGSRNRPL